MGEQGYEEGVDLVERLRAERDSARESCSRLEGERMEQAKIIADYRYRITSLLPIVEADDTEFKLHAEGCPYYAWTVGRDPHEIIMDGIPGWPESPDCTCAETRKGAYWKGQWMLVKGRLNRSLEFQRGLSMMAALGVMAHGDMQEVEKDGEARVLRLDIPESRLTDIIDEDRPFEVRNIPQFDRKVFRIEVLLYPREEDGDA